MIGIEACGSAHHGARKLHSFGHALPPLVSHSPFTSVALLIDM